MVVEAVEMVAMARKTVVALVVAMEYRMVAMAMLVVVAVKWVVAMVKMAAGFVARSV